ncbi:2Fe-2S iron-sulfur cluster-binding protein [Methyloversatilis thermotolerans]|jgi:2Fe-2S ferredoxin|uniref:2Fe-2S iron-sulfur cluster-binding protein n=1 Tax=Methyloversatilis thermotolerans TaxID=1346290 RepID=UPI000378CDE1|nr:2Fe-2S iron-sulfur cluster-binding protein [Methyloversatilis thermotolerans]
MSVIHFILKDGSTRTLQARHGASVMEIAVLGNVPGIAGECGGSCACATCHVYVADADVDRLAPPDDMETDMLSAVAAERLACSRLACQIAMSAELDGLTVRVPHTQS